MDTALGSWGDQQKRRSVGYDLLAPSLGSSALNSFFIIPVAALSEIEETAKGYRRDGQIMVCSPCQKVFLSRWPCRMAVAQASDFSVREII